MIDNGLRPEWLLFDLTISMIAWPLISNKADLDPWVLHVSCNVGALALGKEVIPTCTTFAGIICHGL
jgi:hypothetical protein